MSKMRILIVDDEKVFSDSLSDFLRVLGYEVFNTYNGEEALEILDKEKPDVLISDLKLGGAGILDGDNILTHAKSISPKTVSIICTAFRNESAQRSVMSKGAIRCIFKPIKFAEIESLLLELSEEIDGKNKGISGSI